MISAVKQCWHLRSQGWTDHCLMRPRSCSVVDTANGLGLKQMKECTLTIFTSPEPTWKPWDDRGTSSFLDGTHA